LAVKAARQQANSAEAEQIKCGRALLEHLLNDFLAQSEV